MQSECFCFQEILRLLALARKKSSVFVTKLSSLAFPRKNGQRPGRKFFGRNMSIISIVEKCVCVFVDKIDNQLKIL